MSETTSNKEQIDRRARFWREVEEKIKQRGNGFASFDELRDFLRGGYTIEEEKSVDKITAERRSFIILSVIIGGVKKQVRVNFVWSGSVFLLGEIEIVKDV